MDTVEDILGSNTPTTEQILGPRSDYQKPMSGSIADMMFTLKDNPGTHILESFGQGASQAWGYAETLEHETQDKLKELGVYNDHSKNQSNIIKGFNEAWMRPLIRAGYQIGGGLFAGLSGAQTTLETLGHELETTASQLQSKPGVIPQVAAPVFGMSGEFIGGAASGYVPEHFPVPPEISAGRSVGAIGESESTFLGLKEPTPGEILGRNKATANLPEVQTAPDIHAVARQIAPDVFYDYDILRNKHDLLTTAVNEARLARDNSPTAQAARDEIETILSKVKGIEDNLTNKAKSRLEDIRGGLEDYLSVDSEDMVKAKQALADNYKAMTDMAPDVRAAYREAQSQIAPQEPLGASQEPVQPVASTEAPVEAGQTPEPVVGAIAKDVETQLIDAGRPQDEAQAAAAIIESHYKARAERFGGKLGSAEELYAREAPEVIPGSRKDTQALKVTEADKLSLEQGEVINFEKAKWEKRVNDLKAELAEADRNVQRERNKHRLGIIKTTAERKAFRDMLHKSNDLYSQYLDLQKEGYEKKYLQGKRGSLTINDTKNTLRLFKSADASTFMHETGHQWLEELRQDAQHPEAPADLTSDYKTVRDWLKVEDDAPITRKQHEKFARGFERYLMEGVAPSKELASVFAKFKAWLTQIYQTVQNLRSPITDEIRNVFDRLIVNQPDRTVVAPEESAVGPKVSEPVKTKAPVSAPEAPKEVSPEGVPETQNNKVQGESPFVDKAGNIRLDNLNSNEDIAQTLKDIAAQNQDFLEARRGKVSDQDVIDIAEAAGLSSSDVNLDKLRQMSVEDGIPLASRIFGLRKMLIQSANHIWELMKGDDELAYAEAVTRHVRIQETLSGVTAEWGRAGRAFRSGAEESLRAQTLSEFLKDNVGKTLYQLKQEMKIGAKLDTPAKISGFIKEQRKPSLGEMLLEGFRNWLISGPITHMTYAAGNKLFALYKAIPETAAKALVGSVHEALAGHPIERVYWGEVGEGMYALLYGQREGLKAAVASFKAGQTMNLPGEALANTPFTGSKAIPNIGKLGTFPEKLPIVGGKDVYALPLGTAIRFPGERMVAPIHSWDRTVGYLTNRAQLIYRQAASEGLSGTALRNRIAELEHNTPEDIVKAATGEATEQALMGSPGDLTRRINAFVRWETNLPVLGRTQPLGFLAPFVTVVSNINKLALIDRGPLGLFSQDIKGVNGDFARDTAIAKIGLGTAFAGTALGLTLEGSINPGEPQDYREATIERMTNGLPHSFRIGEMSYAFDRLGILGVQLSIASNLAHAYQLSQDEDYKKAAAYLTYSVGQTFTQEGPLSGFADLLKAIDNGPEYGNSYINNMLSTAALPFSIGMSQMARQIDPYTRQAKTLSDAFRAKIPFASEGLFPKVDIFGQPVPNREYWGVYAQHIDNDPVTKALKTAGYFPAPVRKTINGVQLTDKQYYDYATKSGVTAHMLLTNIVNLPGFSNLPVKTQHDLIQKAVTQSRRVAQAYVLADPANINIIQDSIKMKSDLAKGSK